MHVHKYPDGPDTNEYEVGSLSRRLAVPSLYTRWIVFGHNTTGYRNVDLSRLDLRLRQSTLSCTLYPVR